MEDLRNCPFCGSIAVVDEMKAVNWRGGQPRTLIKYSAQCIIPRCLGHHRRYYVDEKTAIEKWNTRIDEPLAVDKITELRTIIENAINSSREVNTECE